MVFKRGKKGTYYIKFMWQGKTIFRSAHTTNPKSGPDRYLKTRAETTGFGIVQA